MDNPHFGILRFGGFEYLPAKKDDLPPRQRLLTVYEFEFYTEDCQGGLRCDDTFYPARKGCCTLFKPGQNQSTVRPYKGYFLNLETQDPELCDMLDHLPQYFTVWEIGQIVKLIRQMSAVEDPGSLAGRMQLQSCVCQILSLLCPYRKLTRSTDGNLQHQEELLMVDKYIRNHISEDLSLSTLANLCNLDPTYFHKLFVAAFGKTPAQRILDYRINIAKTGLIEGKVSLSELAARCGFSSQTYFCYKFKHATGKTPLQYRNDVLACTKK